ncbi:MAG: DUF4325 domain-containing protein [Bacteroidota bacterium]|jgi:anti-sigma regulatory factor (Ser/Thr protein kinase)
MNVRTYLDNAITKKKEIRVADVVKSTGVSRQFVNVILHEYVTSGKLYRLGKANRSRYVIADTAIIQSAKQHETIFRSKLVNTSLEEDRILADVQMKTGIFIDLPENISKILEYAFTEMLNNAIDHSQSKDVIVKMIRMSDGVGFSVTDHGIGIYRNIKKQKNLSSDLEAVQDLLKGKQTTMPDRHSGEGIFFTSKIADRFSIKSPTKKLVFDNVLNDVFLLDSRIQKGTIVDFWISLSSTHDLTKTFSQYAGDEFEFSKTEVSVNLYKMQTRFVSRSQARRIVSGLEAFNTIVFNFKGIPTIGQSFADEIFRVWKNTHTEKNIEILNANENVLFMINHVQSPSSL